MKEINYAKKMVEGIMEKQIEIKKAAPGMKVGNVVKLDRPLTLD